MPEDERYLRYKTNFYNECNLEGFDFGERSDLRNASNNECFENRCWLAVDDEPYVGYYPDNDCTCEPTTETEFESRSSFYSRSLNTRIPRQTSQIPTKAASVERVEISRHGDRQVVTDINAGYRTSSLDEAQRYAQLKGRKYTDEDACEDGFCDDFEDF